MFPHVCASTGAPAEQSSDRDVPLLAGGIQGRPKLRVYRSDISPVAKKSGHVLHSPVRCCGVQVIGRHAQKLAPGHTGRATLEALSDAAEADRSRLLRRAGLSVEELNAAREVVRRLVAALGEDACGS